ncbi:MAG: hypothetical protein IJV00_10080, partial [Clostridia bacterium]|nr:hypothetical protein [Clostridia bacterium]
AQKKADDIAFTVDQRCAEIIAANAEKIEEEKKTLVSLRKMSSDFRDSLYSQYLTHVKMIKEMELPDPEKVDGDLKTAVEMEKAAMENLDPKKEVYDAAQRPVDEENSSSSDPAIG